MVQLPKIFLVLRNNNASFVESKSNRTKFYVTRYIKLQCRETTTILEVLRVTAIVSRTLLTGPRQREEIKILGKYFKDAMKSKTF